jgi:hypothetical protein
MEFWSEYSRIVAMLRGACTRKKTFMWMSVVIMAMIVRQDLLGVTSLIRATFLHEVYYYALLHLFHSPALMLETLTSLWVDVVMRSFTPVQEQGYVIYASDQLKVAKEGKKMPAVKNLHQESEDNTKPEYIMAHSIQAVSLLVGGPGGSVFAVPLIARICEGLIWRRERKRKTLVDKMAAMFNQVASGVHKKGILVADAYYASGKMIRPMLPYGHHLVTRVKNTAVGYKPPKAPKRPGRGRPKKYGDKVKLKNLFKAYQRFTEADSPAYGEENVRIKYSARKLLWKPIGREVLFVLVKHPVDGNRIFMTTCLDLDPLTVIKIYGLRFKIEVSFKQAIHSLGSYAYHFWMKNMTPIKRGAGNQHLESKSDEYRKAVERKMGAYHRYIQLACIAQGILQYFATAFHQQIWQQFNRSSWLRTAKTEKAPSEMVVMIALRSTFIRFILNPSHVSELVEFIRARISRERDPEAQRPAA